MHQPCVLVTGVGGRSVGYQILRVLLSQGSKYRIVATDASEFSCGLYEANSNYVVPPASSADDYIPAIQHIVEREQVDVILPGTQAEVSVLAAHRDSFNSDCCVLANPAPVVQLCADKKALYTWLADHDFRVPRTASASGWETLVHHCGFPIVGKPTKDTGASRNVAILKNEAEIGHYLQEMTADQIVFQEYVGEADEEYTVGVMVSREGQVIDSIVIHRTLVGLSLGVQRQIGKHSYALSTGYSQGFVIRHDTIQSICEALALEIGIRGPLNIQLRLVDGEVIIFEVHPRFSGTSAIRAEVGFNEPDILIRNFLFGERFGRLSYRTEVAAIRALRHIIVPIDVMARVPVACGRKGCLT